MQLHTSLIRSLFLATAAPLLAWAQPIVLTVLNTASHGAAVSAGSQISIFGADFAEASLKSSSNSPTTSLGGISVKFGDISAQLLSVSPNQIDAVIPFQAKGPLVITSTAGSTSYNLNLTPVAPGIFTQNGAALLFNSDLNQINSIHPQDVVILYATGLGPVDDSGHVLNPVDVYLGERKANLIDARLIDGRPGLYQLTVGAPRLASDRFYVQTGGWQSNIVYLSAYNEDFGSISIPLGNSTANVNAMIDGLYPSTDPSFPQVPCTGDSSIVAPCGFETFSVTLHAGAYSVSLEITPSAAPFDIAAVSEAGRALITVDPAAQTYTASITTLSEASRVGDFHTSVVPLWDYASCNANGVCLPFPGPSILPRSRLPPWWLRAAEMLPSPTSTDPTSPNAVFEMSGKFTGSQFTIDDQNNSVLSKFGGVIQTALGPFGSAFSNFRLYVDGRLVALKGIHYVPAQRCIFTGPLCWQAGTLPGQ